MMTQDHQGDTLQRLLFTRLQSLRTWSARADMRSAWWVTLALRLFCSVFAALPPALAPGLYFLREQQGLQQVPPVIPVQMTGPAVFLTQPWARFDTYWYVEIALHGYGRYRTTAFMPFYPALIRVVGTLLGGHFLLAALVISTLSTFGALLCLYRLTEKLSSVPQAPAWTLGVAVLLPVSFFLMAGYTEALFLWLTLAALLALLKERWGALAILAVLAVLVRHQGLLLSVLVLPRMITACWNLLRADGTRPSWQSWVRAARGPALAMLAGPLTYLVWLLVVGVIFQAPLPWEPLSAPNGWHQHLTWPGFGVLADVNALAHLAIPKTLGFPAVALDTVSALVAGVTTGVAARRLPLGLLLYFIACWCAAVIKVQSGGLLVSATRYLLPLLPLTVLLGERLAKSGPWFRRAWWVIGSWLLLYFLIEFVF